MSVSDRMTHPAANNFSRTRDCTAGVLACGLTNTKAEFFILAWQVELLLVTVPVSEEAARLAWTRAKIVAVTAKMSNSVAVQCRHRRLVMMIVT